MIFTCNRCGFRFTRHIEPKQCPNCGREGVRPATEVESFELAKQLNVGYDAAQVSEYPIKLGRYRHYKGNEYEVLGIATHSETLEPLVVYRALYGEFGLWARPAKMWSEIVKADGVEVPRFSFIGAEEDGGITYLWSRGTSEAWKAALSHYDDLYRNSEIERYMADLDASVVARMSAPEFYSFLHDKYFVWKYTAANRLASTRKQLEKYLISGAMDDLARIHDGLFNGDRRDAAAMLSTALQIKGLGPAGASGLLAVLFPSDFGTVDQFVVKALLRIDGLPEHDRIRQMKPETLSLKDAILLEQLMRDKAQELNKRFGGSDWSPRKIDMVLWSFGR